MLIAAWALLALSLPWQPVRSARDLDARLAIAAAIASTDATEQEAAILMRLAHTESRYVPRVGRCAPGVTRGGYWQVIGVGDAERAAACGTPEEQAELALRRVRRSVRRCRHLPAPERLSVYAAGSCASVRGRRLSRDRWVADERTGT